MQGLNSESGNAHMVEIVRGVQAGEQHAMEELYGIAGNFRHYLLRQLGPNDLPDNIHDLFVIVTEAIQSGRLQKAEKLIPYMVTIAHRYSYRQIEKRTSRRSCEVQALEHTDKIDETADLDSLVYRNELRVVARDIIASMPARKREILMRVYIEEQPIERIVHEMNLRPERFRFFKGMAKYAFKKRARRMILNAARVN